MENGDNLSQKKIEDPAGQTSGAAICRFRVARSPEREALGVVLYSLDYS